MPNVEFFGLNNAFVLFNQKGTIEKVKEALRGHPCLNEMVFTIHEAIVVDKDKQEQPFIRLTSTSREDIPEIIEGLKTLGMDIEVMVLDKFIPAKK